MSGRKVLTRWTTLFAFVIAVLLVLSVPGAYGQAKKGLVDLNTASQKDLEEIDLKDADVDETDDSEEVDEVAAKDEDDDEDDDIDLDDDAPIGDFEDDDDDF